MVHNPWVFKLTWTIFSKPHVQAGFALELFGRANVNGPELAVDSELKSFNKRFFEQDFEC